MKITHLSTYDLSGGAARAAYRLHKGLCSLGHQSRMLALYKASDDPAVIPFVPPRDISTRAWRGLKRRLLERASTAIEGRPAGSTFFSDDRSQHGADVLRRMPATDVLNLHWVANFIDYRSFFRKVSSGLPVAWTLHDMNPFTGGCHYDEGCGKFSQRCGACPQLGSANPKDFSSRVWLRKREAFSCRGGQRAHFVTPSRWLANELKNSSLLSGCSVTVIPYGIDLETFQPRDQRLAREKCGIPRDVKAILFVANSAEERRKGLRVLLDALGGLENSDDYFLVAIGHGLDGQELPLRCKTIGYLDDETALSYVYSAADVFVLPSLQDNLPNTAIEALACGTPTIGSNVGGVAEIVRDGETGVLVSPSESGELRAAIVALLGAPEKRAGMAEQSRRVASLEYSLVTQARRYEALYREILVERPPSGS